MGEVSLRAALSLLIAAAAARAPAAAADPPSAGSNGKDTVQTDRTDVTGLPLVGGDSDIGIGFGETSAITRHEARADPYRWRLESSALITFKPGDARLTVPYQDYFLVFTLPEAVRGLRLEARPSFTAETTQRYSGLGNASPPPDPERAPTHDVGYFEYGRVHPTMALRARLALPEHLHLLVGVSYTQNWIDERAQSQLADDRRSGSPTVRRLLGDTQDHGVALFDYALLYDTRDDETITRSGQYHQAKIRLSPGGTRDLPYRYGQANLTLRAYASPTERITLAARVVGDWQFGDLPFYELARYEDTYALGGVNGVRGVPGQRYSGKIKIFSNLEARARVVSFHLFQKVFVLGGAAFFDAGRLWAEAAPHPELDGTGVGLKYGVGGGARLEHGNDFVARLDVAWSPDARPIGAYFGAGEIF